MRSQGLHVAIIMDGNGRWAQERGLPRIEGHSRGVQSVLVSNKGKTNEVERCVKPHKIEDLKKEDIILQAQDKNEIQSVTWRSINEMIEIDDKHFLERRKDILVDARASARYYLEQKDFNNLNDRFSDGKKTSISKDILLCQVDVITNKLEVILC